RDMTDARRVRSRQLHRVEFVFIPSAQIRARLILTRKLQAIDAREEIEALLEFVSEDFHMRQMRDVIAGLGTAHTASPQGRIGYPDLALKCRGGQSKGQSAPYVLA